MPFFGRKKANFWKTIWAKVSIQLELRISGYKRNGARAESASAETERDREIDPISEGLSPLPCHGDQGPEGEPFSHLGRRPRKKDKEGGFSPSLPVAPERRRGHHRLTAIYTNTSITFTHLSIAVHSPATCCTLYLNMVLYASYYFPMMCCHPMMFWVDFLCLLG